MRTERAPELDRPRIVGWLRSGAPVWSIAGGADDDGDDDKSGDEDQDQDQDGDEDGEGDGSDDSDGDGGDDKDKDEKTYSRTELDGIIDKRLARERKKHERELRAAKRKAAKEGDGDESDASKESQEQVAKATVRAVRSEAKAAAIAAGVPKGRADRFVSLADLDDVDSLLTDDGDLDTAAIEALVDDTLEEWPEFAPAADDGKQGKSGASSTDGHKGDGDKQKVWTRAEIARLSDKEYDEHRDDIMDQVKRGIVK